MTKKGEKTSAENTNNELQKHLIIEMKNSKNLDKEIKIPKPTKQNKLKYQNQK